MTLRTDRILSIEGGSYRSHCVEESFWKRLWSCRLTDYWWWWWWSSVGQDRIMSIEGGSYSRTMLKNRFGRGFVPVVWQITYDDNDPLLFSHGAAAPSGPGPPRYQDLRSHSDTTHSVGHPCTSNQPDAETSTWQHTTLTRDRIRTCGQWDRQPVLCVTVN